MSSAAFDGQRAAGRYGSTPESRTVIQVTLRDPGPVWRGGKTTAAAGGLRNGAVQLDT